MVCPLPEVGRVEGGLLADHSLVEVDVTQVLGGLFGGTHFLVVVDHPSRKWGKGQRRMNKVDIVFSSQVIT